jgi:adenylate cyclase
VGRAKSNTIVLAHEKASRHHATIHAQDGAEFWLIDLGSSNGTRHNGDRVVRPVRLSNGDCITIAEHAFVFHQQDVPPETAGGGETVIDSTRIQIEKRWLLLADIEGYTPLSQRLTPDALARVVGQWVRAGRETVEGNGGRLNKYLGDGYLGCWPGSEPCGAQVADAVKSFRKIREVSEPKFRIVVHHGAVALGGGGAESFGEESLMGPDVNMIFRVEKLAAEKQVHFCFTAAARALMGDRLPFKEVPGEHELKGFPGKHRFYEF